ncbi:uncharacterized protein LOC122665983 [Telopea speciosissima]|uniref:uncharacterized protein LOC122665983 n=1 Tax=Telopea speciosissima TaxID=54955 RepID=UPI001CC829FC|nr:uncharacterized protein LOC122665983 [Telopea speciosissima]
MIYRIWLERNNRLFQQQKTTPTEGVLQQIIQDTRCRFDGSVTPVSDTSCARDFFHRWKIKVMYSMRKTSLHSWLCPPSSSIAINCDGSVKNNMGGYGTIARDHMGRVRFAVAGGSRTSNVLRMELRAIRCGLEKACSAGYPRVHIRSDSLCAIQMVKNIFHTPWHCMDLVDDILNLKERFHCCTFTHVMREANYCADYLASFIRANQELSFSTECLPLALYHLVREDARGRKYQRL